MRVLVGEMARQPLTGAFGFGCQNTSIRVPRMDIFVLCQHDKECVKGKMPCLCGSLRKPFGARPVRLCSAHCLTGPPH